MVYRPVGAWQFDLQHPAGEAIAGAGLRFVTWGISPLGFVLGGILGELIGLQATLLVAVVGPFLSVICLVLSPVVGLRRPPAPEPIVASTTTTP